VNEERKTGHASQKVIIASQLLEEKIQKKKATSCKSRKKISERRGNRGEITIQTDQGTRNPIGGDTRQDGNDDLGPRRLHATKWRRTEMEEISGRDGRYVY